MLLHWSVGWCVVPRLVDGPVITNALAAHGNDCGPAGPLLDHPVWCWHGPQRPDDVAAMANFMVAGFPGHMTAVGQTITDQPKPFAASVLDGDQEVGTALGEEEEKGRLACNASACTSTPSNAMASSSCRSAWVSLPASVA